jgi:hypothetical protein
MKVLKTITEVEEEGLLALIGKKVLVMCVNYFYTGELIGVNDTCIKLENCHQVMETGSHKDTKFKDGQWIGDVWYINISSIESFGETTKTC